MCNLFYNSMGWWEINSQLNVKWVQRRKVYTVSLSKYLNNGLRVLVNFLSLFSYLITLSNNSASWWSFALLYACLTSSTTTRLIPRLDHARCLKQEKLLWADGRCFCRSFFGDGWSWQPSLSDWQLHSDFQGGDTNRDGPPAWLCLIPHLAFIRTSLSLFYLCASSSGARSHPSCRSLPQRAAVGRKTIPNHYRLGESVNAQDNLPAKN